MITRFHALCPDDTLHGVVSELLSSGQRDFPVVDGSGGVVGILPHGDLMTALARGEHAARIGDQMRSGCGSASDSEMLEAAFARMQQAGCGALPVVRDGELVGVMSLENVGEWLMIHARGGRPRPRSEGADVSTRRPSVVGAPRSHAS